MGIRKQQVRGHQGSQPLRALVVSAIVLAPVVGLLTAGSAGRSPSAGGSIAGQWTTYGGNFGRTAEQSVAAAVATVVA